MFYSLQLPYQSLPDGYFCVKGGRVVIFVAPLSFQEPLGRLTKFERLLKAMTFLSTKPNIVDIVVTANVSGRVMGQIYRFVVSDFVGHNTHIKWRQSQ